MIKTYNAMQYSDDWEVNKAWRSCVVLTDFINLDV